MGGGTRALAAAAGLAVAVGAVVMLIALVAVPGPWIRGYVSEAGTTGQPYAPAYRGGLILLAAGVALLALALRRRWVVALLLGAAALLAATSGAVSCSNRCPLPPFEPTTVADVVHTAASIAGTMLLFGAMVAVARTDLAPAIRRQAVAAAALTVPLGAALGLTMVFAGRGAFGAALERALLVVAVTWLAGTSAAAALAAPGRGDEVHYRRSAGPADEREQ